MNIKCTEDSTGGATYRKFLKTETNKQASIKRMLQIRKRALTSMGWRYHL